MGERTMNYGVLLVALVLAGCGEGYQAYRQAYANMTPEQRAIETQREQQNWLMMSNMAYGIGRNNNAQSAPPLPQQTNCVRTVSGFSCF
jgi:hypothetical protein